MVLNDRVGTMIRSILALFLSTLSFTAVCFAQQPELRCDMAVQGIAEYNVEKVDQVLVEIVQLPLSEWVLAGRFGRLTDECMSSIEVAFRSMGADAVEESLPRWDRFDQLVPSSQSLQNDPGLVEGKKRATQLGRVLSARKVWLQKVQEFYVDPLEVLATVDSVNRDMDACGEREYTSTSPCMALAAYMINSSKSKVDSVAMRRKYGNVFVPMGRALDQLRSIALKADEKATEVARKLNLRTQTPEAIGAVGSVYYSAKDSVNRVRREIISIQDRIFADYKTSKHQLSAEPVVAGLYSYALQKAFSAKLSEGLADSVKGVHVDTLQGVLSRLDRMTDQMFQEQSDAFERANQQSTSSDDKVEPVLADVQAPVSSNHYAYDGVNLYVDKFVTELAVKDACTNLEDAIRQIGQVTGIDLAVESCHEIEPARIPFLITAPNEAHIEFKLKGQTDSAVLAQQGADKLDPSQRTRGQVFVADRFRCGQVGLQMRSVLQRVAESFGFQVFWDLIRDQKTTIGSSPYCDELVLDSMIQVEVRPLPRKLLPFYTTN